MIKRFAQAVALAIGCVAAQGAVVTQWDFNSPEFDFSPATGTFAAATGTGTSVSVGVVTNSFGSVASGATSDPNTGDNTQVRLGSFPAQGTGNKENGMEFRTSTEGQENIRLTWDHYNSNTGSRYWRIQYTVNGVDWLDHNVYENITPTQWLRDQSVSFNSAPGVNNNPNFGVRIVSEFESTATGAGADEYRAVNATSGYGSAGTLWIDMVTIHGDPLDTGNQQPVVSAIADVEMRVNTPSALIPFTVSDAETPAAQLTVSAAQANFDLISAVELAGQGGNRSLRIVPVADQTGSSLITIRVEDAGGKFMESSFTARVLPTNTAPVIGNIARQETTRGVGVGPVAFTISDLETPAQNLALTWTSSNPVLLPVENIVLGGSGENRTVTLIPSMFDVGTSVVTLSASDGTLETEASFLLIVSSPRTAAVWDFNSKPADSNAGTGSHAAEGGSPATALGGVAESFGSVAGGGTSDPAVVDNTMLRLGTFPAQGTENKTAGSEFRASTAGLENITLRWDHYNSNTGSRYWRIQYTLDGVEFVDHVVFMSETPTTWLLANTVSFNTVPGANNNPNFGVRIVSEFESTATGSGADEYDAVNEGSGYGTAGTLWLDMVMIGGDPLDAGNSQPTISEIPHQTTREGTPTDPIAFTVSDAETSAAQLTVTASAARPELISSITFGGSGSGRSVTITPAAGATGETEVIVRVTDAGGKFAERPFVLTILPSNTAPMISAIAAQETTRNTPVTVAFTVTDAEQGSAAVQLTAVSSNESLVPASALQFSGTGEERTLTISPAAGAVGASDITVTANDGSLSSTATFRLHVLPREMIALWTFNSNPPDTSSNTGTWEPAVGAGTGMSIGVVTNSFGSVAAGGSSDPAAADNSMVRVGSFAAQGTGNKENGLEFRASTVGKRDIVFMWDHYNSNTGSRYWRVQYSTDGSSFTDHGVHTNSIGTTWRHRNMVGFSGIPGVENNPDFAVRLVAEFESTATGEGQDAYVAVNTGSNYGTAGTLWVDMVSIGGDPAGAAEPPQLTVQQGPGEVTVTWPETAEGFRLEAASALPATTWSPVPNEPVRANGLLQVTLAATERTLFFRLAR